MDDDEKIVLSGAISAMVSIIFCFILIIIYFISCCQIKSNKNKLSSTQESKDDLLETNEKKSLNNSIHNSSNNSNMGLGSHFMLIIAITNFMREIFEFSFYFYYKEIHKNGQKLDEMPCTLFAFAHNFFILYSVCWISMLTYLFYCSTDITSDIFYKTKKYLIIGFLYSSITSLIFTAGPLFTKSYGDAGTKCSL